jgi:hypothetical protein
MCFLDQRRQSCVEAHYVNQVSGESGKLDGDQPYVPMMRHEKIRVRTDRDHAYSVQDEHGGQQKRDVAPLIAQHHRAKAVIRFSGAVLHARANQTHVVEEQNPADGDESSAESEPTRRLGKLRKQDRFNERTCDVKKVVSELEWPANYRDDVQHRARPEDQNSQQSGEDVRPIQQLSLGDHIACAFDQNSERYALNDAHEREFYLDNH